jgi:hypothetical protein
MPDQPSARSVASLKRSSSNPPMNEPLSKRTPTILESVPDDFDDTTHQRMDHDVLDLLSDGSFIPFLLLATIASNSDDRLDSKYKDTANAKALIEKHPQLRGMLQDAWEAKSFKDLRNLSALSRCRGIGQPPNVTLEILRNADSQFPVMYAAWKYVSNSFDCIIKLTFWVRSKHNLRTI